MANRKHFKMSVDQRRQRTFSDNFKKQKAQELEMGLSSIPDLEKQYEISRATIYKWIRKFGSVKKKTERIIVENESDTKELLALKKKIAELEQIIGQKQVQLDFKDKMIDIAEEMYQIDIKKKFGSKPSDGSGITENV
jgi:transposase-like protein